jgi:hypothetical protein
MSDPRYIDPVNDPRRTRPNTPGELRDDAGRTGIWSWIIGIVAVIVVAMLVYNYTRPDSTTASNPPSSNSSTTTGAAPASVPSTPPAAKPAPTLAIPAPDTPANPAPATPH